MCVSTRYALLDWDNTLREGFTITSWTKYLCDKKAVHEDAYCKLMRQFDLYHAKQISYQQLGNTTTEIYAQALVGVEVSLIEQLAYSFCQQDKAIFKFAGNLFKLFQEKGVETIVISGSPQIVLAQYAKQLGISEIHGMDIEIQSNKYTGAIKQDFGAEKELIVKEIYHARKGAPLIALGDSIADEPLLKVAEYGYLLDRERKMIMLNGYEVAPLSSIETVIKECISFSI